MQELERKPRKKHEVYLPEARLHVFNCEGMVVVQPEGEPEDRMVLTRTEARTWQRIMVAAGACRLAAAVAQAINKASTQAADSRHAVEP